MECPGVKKRTSDQKGGQVMTSRGTMIEPTPLSPHDLLLSELPGLLSLWKYDRAGGKMWQRTGLGIIVAWAGLQRLVAQQPPSDWHQRLDELMLVDATIFLEVALASRFEYESWRRDVEQINTAWDRDLSREEAEDLEWRSEQTFEALDHAELVAWFAAKQAPADARVQALLGKVPWTRIACDPIRVHWTRVAWGTIRVPGRE